MNGVINKIEAIVGQRPDFWVAKLDGPADAGQLAVCLRGDHSRRLHIIVVDLCPDQNDPGIRIHYHNAVSVPSWINRELLCATLNLERKLKDEKELGDFLPSPTEPGLIDFTIYCPLGWTSVEANFLNRLIDRTCVATVEAQRIVEVWQAAVDRIIFNSALTSGHAPVVP